MSKTRTYGIEDRKSLWREASWEPSPRYVQIGRGRQQLFGKAEYTLGFRTSRPDFFLHADRSGVKDRRSFGYGAVGRRLTQKLLKRRVVTTLPTFLRAANRMIASGKIDNGLDIIYDHVDSLLRENQFTQVDQIFSGLNADELEVDTLLALLTVTLPARSKLQARPKLFSDVFQSFQNRQLPFFELLRGLES